MIELLLLGILIMLMLLFHSNASASGRYAKVFDFIVHRPTKYVEHKATDLCKKTLTKIGGKLNGK